MIAAAALLLGLATPAPSPTPEPYQIYKRAMEHLAALPQPAYIIDTEHWITVSRFAGGSSDTHDWDERRIFDSTNRRECVLNVPFNPSHHTPQIGESYFAPDTWLIGQRQPAPASDSSNIAPDLSDLKTIASVISIGKQAYDIRLVAVETLTHGASAFHLSLHPRSDPMRHNLRELWINTSTFDIMRAVIEGNYRPTYSDMVQDTFVSEDFGRIGPYWLMIHHVWTYGDPFSSLKYQDDATSTAMQFPPEIPGWFFDAKLFLLHLGDVPAIIGGP